MEKQYVMILYLLLGCQLEPAVSILINPQDAPTEKPAATTFIQYGIKTEKIPAESTDETPPNICNVCCQGPAGLPGIPGAAGAAGAAGTPGNNGLSGRDGIKGEPGSKGDIGEPGECGQPGLPGPQGPSGIGSDGNPGPQGLKGMKGVAGSDGSPGPVGEKGQKGDTGVQRRSAFSVAKTIRQNGNAGDTLKFDQIETNIGGHYSSSTNKFTCQFPGTYVFAFTITSSGSYNEPFVHLMKGGSIKTTAYVIENDLDGDMYLHASQTVVLQLVVGNQVWLKFGSNNEYLYGSKFYPTTFSGFLIYESSLSSP